jgi:hypothetical protein
MHVHKPRRAFARVFGEHPTGDLSRQLHMGLGGELEICRGAAGGIAEIIADE